MTAPHYVLPRMFGATMPGRPAMWRTSIRRTCICRAVATSGPALYSSHLR